MRTHVKNIKVRITGTLWKGFTGDRWILPQRASNAEKATIFFTSSWPWKFLGATLKFNGTPGNIHVNIGRYGGYWGILYEIRTCCYRTGVYLLQDWRRWCDGEYNGIRTIRECKVCGNIEFPVEYNDGKLTVARRAIGCGTFDWIVGP